MQLVRSLLFAMIFYPATLAFVLVGMLASLSGSSAARAVVHRWSDLHHLLVTRLLAIRVRIEGEMPPGPVLVAVKHESMMETIEILRIASTPVVVMKRQLSSMPLFGWMTHRYGVIPVDREAGAKALREMLTLGRKAVADQRPIVIFPEGTRVPPGETPPLRSGFAGLYRVVGVPVVPIAVDSGKSWGRGLLKKRGTVRFVIGEPIPAGLDRSEIEARVHAAINLLSSAA